MHKKQRGKNEESNTNINSNIKTFPIKIKILLAYLKKILYLWAEGKVRDYKKNSLLERDEHRTPTLRNTAEKTGHLCWMTSNPMNDVLNPNVISGNGRRWDVGILFRRNRQNDYCNLNKASESISAINLLVLKITPSYVR